MFYAFEHDTTPLYTTAKNVFTQEECSKIIKIGKSLNLQNAGLVENSKGDEKIRKSDVSWIRPEEKYKWIFERVRKFVVYINDNAFKFDIHGLNEGLQFTHYQAPGGQYRPHIDKHYNYIIRRLSFSIILNDPREFDGGDLLLFDGEEGKKKIKKLSAKILFPRYVLHQVTPVTRGERFSLVGWVTGKNIR